MTPPTPIEEQEKRVTRVLVCGSRNWTDVEPIAHAIADLAWENDERLTVIHGGARGADTIAGEVADRLGLNEMVFPADWERHGKQAGFIRNRRMLDERPDLVLAFQIYGSRGTQHTIDEARRRCIPVEVHEPVPSLLQGQADKETSDE